MAAIQPVAQPLSPWGETTLYDMYGNRKPEVETGLSFYSPSSSYNDARTDYLTAQTALLGRPQVQETTISPYGPKPVMGRLTTPQTPTRQAVPDFIMPEMGELPEFVAPKWDEGKISKLTQQKAAPQTRRLRSSMQNLMAQRYSNPNERAKILRAAFGGYGEGLESVLAGAGQAASTEYAQRYANEYKTAGMNWQEAVTDVRQKYETGVIKSQQEYLEKARAVEQIYAAEIQTEQQRVAEENQRIRDEYSAALAAYMKLGTTTTTSGYSGLMPGDEAQSALDKLKAQQTKLAPMSILSAGWFGEKNIPGYPG